MDTVLIKIYIYPIYIFHIYIYGRFLFFFVTIIRNLFETHHFWPTHQCFSHMFYLILEEKTV